MSDGYAPCSRSEAVQLDAGDPLSEFRDRFILPEGIVYLDGNSLGPPMHGTIARVNDVLEGEWGAHLVESWTRHDWIDLPERVADAIAGLIGAGADEIAVADSTSVNIFKLLGAALRLRPGRRTIVSEKGNFGTDLYIAQGLADLLGNGKTLRVVGRSEIASALDDTVAVLMLTHVDFRTGERHDMQRLTAAAHGSGALVLWDLAHSAGAMPVDLAGIAADFAVGCGYKYLNGGPGAPAFAFVARRHHPRLNSPLWGWMGHDAPFEFGSAYRPAPGVGRLRVGTPPILSLVALECGVAGVSEIGVERLREKSVALTGCFIDLVERDCRDYGLEIVTPRDPHLRGSQVSLRHRDGYPIMQALRAAGVIGDFRAPDLLRFGFAPAYVRFVDVWDAVSALREIMGSERWKHAAFQKPSKVT